MQQLIDNQLNLQRALELDLITVQEFHKRTKKLK